MRNLFIVMAVVWGLSTLPVESAWAANPKCPQCKMTLASKKSKAMPTPIKYHGKSYFCCAGCKPAVYGVPAKAKKAKPRR